VKSYYILQQKTKKKKKKKKEGDEVGSKLECLVFSFLAVVDSWSSKLSVELFS
jgi:hypothetical protein